MNDILKFSARMRTSANLEEQISCLLKVLKQYDYQEFIFGAVPSLTTGRAPALLFVDNVKKEWREEYNTNGYAQYDLAVQHCLTEEEPLLWSSVNEAEDSGLIPAPFKHVGERARFHGYTNGVTIPLFTYWSPLRFGMSLIRLSDNDTAKHDREFRANSDGLVLISQIFFTYARLKETITAQYGLSDEDLELMSRLAAGETRASIAASERSHAHNVKYRLNRIFKKMDARNAEQALVLFTLLGLHEQ
ncbi:Transcriptional activator protein vanR [Actibacterium atlanticum]|uniref:Transcriptional activator protein vanR n=1 Tax=Actibacterium atlanticum TaxID=1461693 RepID=A0A058ZMJ2_9RHOB|nr:autoinducer binding domain-containing protein [Actibacterium atlanticum]KCV82455.1 Transcriptional activator protein vanR [Actibacterium atlanticum]